MMLEKVNKEVMELLKDSDVMECLSFIAKVNEVKALNAEAVKYAEDVDSLKDVQEELEDTLMEAFKNDENKALRGFEKLVNALSI